MDKENQREQIWSDRSALDSKGDYRLTFGSYALLLLWLLLEGRWQTLYESILVPGVSFVAVSVFRSICPARRPYEELAIQPLLVKETKGKVFPAGMCFPSR